MFENVDENGNICLITPCILIYQSKIMDKGMTHIKLLLHIIKLIFV